MKYLNCSGQHAAVTFTFPEKKKPQQEQNNGPRGQTLADPTPPSLPAHSPFTNPNSPTSYAEVAANSPQTALNGTALVPKVQACASAAFLLEKENPTLFPLSSLSS